MTLYDLTQALLKRKRFVAIAGAVSLFLALILAFTIEDGSLAWRGGEKWEAGVQIAVVSRGNESLINAETRSEHLQAAELYAGILESNEAASWIGEANGFELNEPVDAELAGDTALITATLIGPSETQAKESAVSIYDYLRTQLDTPLASSGVDPTPTTIPTVELTGPFESAMTMRLDPALADAGDNLFLEVDTEVGSSLVVPVSRTSGTGVSIDTTLAPIMTLVVTLEDSRGNAYDTIRLALPPVDGFTAHYPELDVVIEDGAITSSLDEDDELTYQLNDTAVSVDWEQGSPVDQSGEFATVPVDVALITDDPAASQIGGRRGPILLGAVLVLAVILILTAVIVAESWSKEREMVSEVDQLGSTDRPDRHEQANDEISGFQGESRSRGESGQRRDAVFQDSESEIFQDSESDLGSPVGRLSKWEASESGKLMTERLSGTDDGS